MRSEKRFASVAERVNCHALRPNRRWSSSPAQMASSVGSMWVMPRRSWRSTAATVGSGPWPAIAPVSPRQKSMYSWPSTHENHAPLASSTKSGNGPAHLTIQFMGTPSRSERWARSWSAADRGWSATKRVVSASIRSVRRERSRDRGPVIASQGCTARLRGADVSREAGRPVTRRRRPVGSGPASWEEEGLRDGDAAEPGKGGG
jgi:hypothetical protein